MEDREIGTECGMQISATVKDRSVTLTYVHPSRSLFFEVLLSIRHSGRGFLEFRMRFQEPG